MRNLNLKYIDVFAFSLGTACVSLIAFLPTNALAESKSSLSALNVSSKGRPPSSANVKIKSSKVPSFDWSKKSTTSVPRLDIGEEATLKYDASPLNLPAEPTPVVQKKYAPVAPALKVDEKLLKLDAANFKQIKKLETEAPEAIKALKPFEDPELKNPTLMQTEIKEYSAEQYRLLEARIMNEVHKQNELAIGILAELLDSKNLKYEVALAYSQIARQLDLSAEYKGYAKQVINESKNSSLIKLALNDVLTNAQHLEYTDVPYFEEAFKKHDINTDNKASWHLIRAKYFLETGGLTQVEESLSQISEKDPEYVESLLVSGLSKYRQAKIDDAQGLLSLALERTEGEKLQPLRNLAALTLGRIYFQKSQYKEAFNAYLKVDKSSPHWLSAMQEQAWTQILSEDYEGAAGNMFSLHTDFFKNAYAPDTYLIRTVGYLNLCQFGDASKVMDDFQKRYGTFKMKIDSFLDKKPKTPDYYEIVRTWLKNPDQKEVQGVPRSFIVELARHPLFISLQSSINSREDELTKLNKVALTIISIERDSLAQKQSLLKELSQRKEKLGAKNADIEKIQAEISGIEKTIERADTYYTIAKRARNYMKAPREKASTRLDKEKAEFKLQIAGFLQKRFKDVSEELTKALDQSEVLKYEIYSAAGEHLRYQMAGGQVNDKDREQLKAPNEKAIKWKFKGEIWEDEVGHFRSSLKNVCPKN